MWVLARPTLKKKAAESAEYKTKMCITCSFFFVIRLTFCFESFNNPA